LHHIRFENGVSVNKSDLEPFAILKVVDLSRPGNSEYLLDLMGTVPIGWEEHAELHQSAVSGDIGDIPPNKLPWALRNKENFESFRSQLGLDVNFEEFLNRQRNIPHSLPRTPSRLPNRIWAAVGACFAILAVAVLTWKGLNPALVSGGRGLSNTCPPDRPIKGISVKGDRIYRKPGDPLYDQTIINEAAGERCFPDVREAKRAGWRAATR
jgi:hypothetical protein